MPTDSDKFTSRAELEAELKSFAKIVLEVDRPDDVDRGDWDGKVLAYLAEYYTSGDDWYTTSTRDVQRTRQVTKYRTVAPQNQIASLPVGARIFAAIGTLGTSEVAGVAAQGLSGSREEAYQEEEKYTETVTEYSWNQNTFRTWRRQAGQQLTERYTRLQQQQQTLERMQQTLNELALANGSRAQEVAQLRTQLQQLCETASPQVMQQVNERLDQVERQLSEGADISADDLEFVRWSGEPTRAL